MRDYQKTQMDGIALNLPIDKQPYNKKRGSNLSRLKCFHNGIILIVNCLKFCVANIALFFQLL